MLHMFFRAATARAQHGALNLRRLGAAGFLVILLGAVLLARPVLASAHTSTAATRQSPVGRAIPNGVPVPDPCLLSTFWNEYLENGPNTGVFHIEIDNLCPFPVKGIAVWYTLSQINCWAPGAVPVGSGDTQGSFLAPDLPAYQPGQRTPYETTDVAWNSYCIVCHDGVIVGFPEFLLDVKIILVRGFSAENLVQVAVNQGGGGIGSEDNATLMNWADDPGPLVCPP